MSVTLVNELVSGLYAALFGFGAGLAAHGLFVLRVLLGVSAGSAIPARLAAFRFPCIRPPAETGTANLSHRMRGLLLFLCDFLFALCVGLGFLFFLYAYHDGVFRLFLLLAAALGAVLYFFTLGRLVVRVLGTVSYLLRVLLSYLALTLLLPLRLFLCVLLFLARTALSHLLSMLSCLLAPLVTRAVLYRAMRESKAYILSCAKNN